MDRRQIWRSPPRTFRWRFEVPRGPVVESLKGRGFAVYAINPKQLDRFSPAASKDDSLDVRVLADALRTDLRHFRRIDPVGPADNRELIPQGSGRVKRA